MQNGYFQLVNAPGGYGLQIFQPKDGGAEVNLQEVLNYLERESVPYDPMAIKKAILSGEDTVCFLERKDCPALEETYSIEVSQDNMQVILRFYPASQSLFSARKCTGRLWATDISTKGRRSGSESPGGVELS